MKPKPKKSIAKVALALTWDGARWPVTSLPAKARSFLSAKGFSSPTRQMAARLLTTQAISELRICWVPRLKGGENVLAEMFPAPAGKRAPFRAVKTARFGDVLGVTYLGHQ